MTENIAGILSASYKPQREAEQDFNKMGYTYDQDLSSMDTKVFVDKDNNPHIAYRGTVRAETWGDNLKIALGGKSKIDTEAVETAKNALGLIQFEGMNFRKDIGFEFKG
jgi:phosphoribosylamine-glycine ligase